MIYSSDAITLQRHDDDVAELQFDLQGESVNKFNQLTVQCLTEALDALEKESGIRGLLVTSAKGVFIVGADITEFTALFDTAGDDIAGFTAHNNSQLQPPRSPALSQRRGHQRLRHGRRPGNLPGLRLPRHEHGSEDRPAGDQARHPARLGRHGAPAAHHRRR
jgi:hypothetical protein